MRSKLRSQAIKKGFRSGLEEQFSAWLKANYSDPVIYEGVKIKYTVPSSSHTYTPDFYFPSKKTNLFIETKGRFVSQDRKKQLLIKQQHPEYDIRFVFSNPSAKINKGSKTTYGMWCEKNGFKYCSIYQTDVLLEWLNES